MRNNMARKSRLLTITFLLSLLGSSPAVAVGAAADEATIAEAQKGSQGNTMADGLASKMTNGDASQVEYSKKEGEDNSRKNAAATAGKSAGKGQALHTAIGAAMTATAIPMLMSPIAAVRAAGAALLAKGVLEFAQAGADSGVKDKNNAQRDLLSQKANQEGEQAKAAQAAAKALDNPELNKILSDRGVSPEDFANKVASGEVSDPESILKAAGDTAEFSPADLEKGDAIASGEMKSIFDNAMGDPINSTRLGYQENENATTAGGGSGSSGGGSSKESALEKALAEAGVISEERGVHFAANKTSPDSLGEGKGAGTVTDLDATKNLLASLFGADAPKVAAGLAVIALERMGILKAKRKQNIFQIAHRNYRGWGKWRRKISRLAYSDRP